MEDFIRDGRLDANFFSCPILIWCRAQKVVAGPHTNRSVAHIKFFIQMCTHAAPRQRPPGSSREGQQKNMSAHSVEFPIQNQVLTPKLSIIIAL
jgi:hypothetical protein